MKVKDTLITLCFMNGLASIIGFVCLTKTNIMMQILIIFICIINIVSMPLAEKKDMAYNLIALNSFSVVFWIGAVFYELALSNIISSIILGGIGLLNLISLYILTDIIVFRKGN